jgi:hypothetical protein
LTPEISIGLAERASTVEQRAGDKAADVPALPGTNMRRVRLADHGVTLLVARSVIAIFLSGENAPAVELRQIGVASQPVKIAVGMSQQELQNILGGNRPEGYLVDSATKYVFYHEIGLAVRFAEGKVVELVIAPLPRPEPKRG